MRAGSGWLEGSTRGLRGAEQEAYIPPGPLRRMAEALSAMGPLSVSPTDHHARAPS